MRDPLGLCGVVLEGRYRVDEVVGEGGFGVVYRGVHLGLGGTVAIKALKLDPQAPAAERERVLEAFDAEGKLLFSLAQRHPAFARVLDRGLVTRRAAAAGTLPTGDYMDALSSGREDPLFPYLVLEWLEGETLAEEQTRRREAGAPARSLAEVVELLAPIAEALGVGHAERIAHRDVKPSNIFLLVASAGVRVKLLDFGVAKLMTTTSTDPQDEKTGARRAAFTPNYAAPEQWLKSYGATGPWTDVYALALVCVELLGTRPALEGDDAGQLMGATFAPERPTPRARGVVVSDAVDAVFARALALMPEERYRSANEFWGALVTATRTSRARDEEDAPASEAAPASASDEASPRAATPTASRATSSRSGKRRTTPSARPSEPRTRPSARDEAAPGASGPESGEPARGRLLPIAGWTVLVGGLAAGGVLLARNVGSEREAPSSASASAASAQAASASATSAQAANVSAVPGSDPSGPGASPVTSGSAPSTASASAPSAAPATSAAAPGGCPEAMVPFAGGSLLGTPVAPFCLDATEVTVAAYEQCVVTGRCAEAGGTLGVVDHAALKFPTDERALGMWRRACNRGKDRYPVNCVTWSEARTYCEAAGKRLPAYSEWKLAECPSPTDVYPWGRDLPAPFYANLCGTECSGAVKPDQISHADNWIHSAVVGATRKLPQGVYDLAGNVAEWVEGAGDKKYALGSHFLDGRRDALGCGAQRLVSGDNRAPNVGFRCAADPQKP